MDNVTLIRVVSGFIFLFVLIPLYFLPTFLAWNKRQRVPILVLNIFLGWTFLGWIGALIWALADAPQASSQPVSILCASCGKYTHAGAQFCSNCGQSLSARAIPAR